MLVINLASALGIQETPTWCTYKGLVVYHSDLTPMIAYQGASTVKWTALDPCSGLSESDAKLYNNFEFYEIKIHKHLENI